MPLSERVSFEAQIQKRNMVQVPKIIRWQFKMDPQQVLRVGINLPKEGSGTHYFFAKMRGDGRIVIPKLIVSILQGKMNDLLGFIFVLTLDPA